MNNRTFQPSNEEIGRLRDFISDRGCEVFEPGSEGYARATRIWNGAVKHEPALIALCVTASDVRLALTAAQALGVPVSVRGGGHDWVGRGLRHGGLVIDLSAMRKVVVNVDAKEATVGGGALAADISAAATACGLAAVTGYSGAVGMAGLVLGGGYGPLTTRFGLASDSLLSAEVVLADGRLVTADEVQNPMLFWALRGGGGNFGVVISMRIRLHAPGTIMAGRIVFPWSDARTVLQGYAEIMAGAPDALATAVGMAEGPDGKPVIVLLPVWTGAAEPGQQIMARLQSLGTPIVSKIAPMSAHEMLASYDAQVVDGRHNAVRTRWLADLSADAIDALVTAFEARTSRFSSVVMHHFHGVGARVSPAASAFGVRQEHFTILMYSTWEQGADADADVDVDVDAIGHTQWVAGLSCKLAPLALPGGYANLLAPDAIVQITSAYGDNASRLREVKRQYDPNGVFSSAIPLPLRNEARAIA